MKKPLEGMRVVEVAHFVAVPAAGALLADLGADVVKVELPPRGEIYRRSKPMYTGYECDFPEGPGFHLDNRGKRSIALDLTRPEAREAAQRLVERAEVMITNLLPERRRKYGLDHASLLERHPRLVVGAINGYGTGGDEADEPAFDYSAYWARTGMMDLLRDEGVPPSMLRPGVGDHAAASNLVCGILAALRLRDADGRGRYVEVSLLQTGFHILGCDTAMALVTGQPVRRHDRARTLNPLWNSYPTADDRWLMLVMIDPDRYWPRFCEAIGRADLAADERYDDGFKRAARAQELIAELERVIRQRTLAEWRERLDAAGLIWSPVQTIDEAVRDPQARAMGYFGELEHPEAGPFETLDGPPFRIEGTPLGADRAASAYDTDAADVLRDVGLDLTPEERARLSGAED